MPVSGEFLKHYSFCRNSIYKNDRFYLNLAQSDLKLVVKIRDAMFLFPSPTAIIFNQSYSIILWNLLIPGV